MGLLEGEGQSEGVDIDADTASEGNYYVGWGNDGEWLEYTVAVAADGYYNVSIRYKILPTLPQGRLLVDGVDVSGTIVFGGGIGSIGSWKIKTVSGIWMTQGEHIVRFQLEENGHALLLDWMHAHTLGNNPTTTVMNAEPASSARSLQSPDSVTVQRVTYMLDGRPVAVKVTDHPDADSNGLFYLHTDHLGSVTAMTDESGNLVDGSVARHMPFGAYREQPATNPDVTDRGFTGHRMNNTGANDLGLIYMNARFYAPELRRFISADTIVPQPGNPQAFNRYAYVYNDAINLIDPTGHFTEDAVKSYLQETYPDDWQTYLDAWMSNSDWWSMLMAAEANDILFGIFDPYGGVPSGFYFQFKGSGKERLDGLSFMSAESSALPPWIGGSLNWQSVNLSLLFSGKRFYGTSYASSGQHTIRLSWAGVMEGSSGSPVYLREGAIVKLSSGLIDFDTWNQRTLRGESPITKREVAVAVVAGLAIELAEIGICGGFGDVCSLVYAGATGGLSAGTEYGYEVISGSVTFEFAFERQSGISNGITTYQYSSRWIQTRR